MNIDLWVVQAVLALAFIAAGSMKVFGYEKYKAMSEKNGPMDLKRGLVTFIGLAELAGAIGVVLPKAANVAPWLSPIAALGLATVMLLAVLYHLRRHEPPAVPATIFFLALFVAGGGVFSLRVGGRPPRPNSQKARGP